MPDNDSATTAVRCVWPGRCALGESIVWDDRRGELIWVDIRGEAVHCLDPARERHTAIFFPGLPGAVALMNGDDCLVAADSALYRLDRSTGLREHLLDVEPDRPFNRLNDGRCDRDGRFWVGSMNRDRGPRTGALYRIAGDGRVSRMRDGIGMSNSLSFGANTMTFCDSEQGDILLYAGDLTATALPQPRVLAHVDPSQDGLADGAAMDEEGAVWVALAYGGRVLRLAPDGTVLRDMHLPVSKPTCCAFGGPDLRTLYITTSSTKLSPEQLAREPLAGSVLAVDVSVRGLPEPRWG